MRDARKPWSWRLACICPVFATGHLGCKSRPWANDEERAAAYAKENESLGFWREATGGRWDGDPDTDGFNDD